MKKSKLISLRIALAASLLMAVHTSCYRMPGENEYSVIPATNNPDVIGKSCNSSCLPGAGF